MRPFSVHVNRLGPETTELTLLQATFRIFRSSEGVQLIRDPAR